MAIRLKGRTHMSFGLGDIAELAGKVIGGMVGGPTGAMIGSMIGSWIGNAISGENSGGGDFVDTVLSNYAGGFQLGNGS